MSKNILTLTGNFIAKLEPILFSKFHAKKIEDINNNVDQRFCTYKVGDSQSAYEINVAVKEDFGEYTTTINATGEVLEQIQGFLED